MFGGVCFVGSAVEGRGYQEAVDWIIK